MRSVIEALEKSGAAPALDQSTDIKGPDGNGNCVRDDLEAVINSLPLTPLQIKAALQKARANQSAHTVDLTDKVVLQRVGASFAAGIVCLGKVMVDSYSLSAK